MLDFLLGAVILGLAVRGWWRGLVREAIALAVVVVGLFVSFRLSRPGGRLVESLVGLSPEVGRLLAGVTIFLAIGLGAAVTSVILHKGIRFVPGLPTLNRAAGAGFSVVATVAVATLALSLLTVLSPPEVIARQIDDSAFAEYLTDPDGAPQKAIGAMSGDRVLERLLGLRELTGSRRVVGDDVVVLPPTPPEAIGLDDEAEAELIVLINRERVAAGRDPLVTSTPLARVARAYAGEMYVSGRFAQDPTDGTTLEIRLAEAGIPVVTVDQVIALAVTAEAAQAALFEDEEESAVLTDPAYGRVGIGVAEGPFGTILVEVLAD